MTASNGAGVDPLSNVLTYQEFVRMAGVPLYRPDRTTTQVSFPLLRCLPRALRVSYAEEARDVAAATVGNAN